jgi:hypothetical protein
MKRSIVRMMQIAAALLLCAGAATTARAQEERIVVKVPFAFAVGDLRMPAGTYDVQPSSQDLGVVEIQNEDRKESTYAMTIPLDWERPAQNPALIFEKHDGEYVLAKIVEADGNERQLSIGAHDHPTEIVATPAVR